MLYFVASPPSPPRPLRRLAPLRGLAPLRRLAPPPLYTGPESHPLEASVSPSASSVRPAAA
jgi:hypothetical protein